MERVPSCCAAAADREAASQLKEHAMARMEAMVTIVRPVEEVFGFFLALDENAPKVDPSAGSVVKSPEGPAGPGTTFRFRQHTLGKVRETTTRFTGVEPNRKIEFEAEIGPMRPRCDLIFEQAGGGTRVTSEAIPIRSVRLGGSILSSTVRVSRCGARLARVKTVLEASAT
jgi:hypothetical protein